MIGALCKVLRLPLLQESGRLRQNARPPGRRRLLPEGVKGLHKTSRPARNAQQAAQRAVAGGGKRRNVTLGTLKRLMARIVPSL